MISVSVLLPTDVLKFKAVKGHAEIERCDELSVAESMKYRTEDDGKLTEMRWFRWLPRFSLAIQWAAAADTGAVQHVSVDHCC